MQDTVAIALITSLSTLSAAALTGLAAARQTKGQLRYQLAQSREERAAHRADRHRELRREAYEQFLGRADAAYRVLDERWYAETLTSAGSQNGGFAARRALDEAVIRVQLEGPPDVAAQAAEVAKSIEREFRQHQRVVNDHPDGLQSAAKLDPSGRRSALDVRYSSSGEFLTVARAALDSAQEQVLERSGLKGLA